MSLTLTADDVKLAERRVTRIVRHATEAHGATTEEAELVRTAARNLSHNQFRDLPDGGIARLLVELVRG